MTLAQLRRYALSLEGATEAPHFERTSFRVGGKIFATARPTEPFVHVFVGEELREPALAVHAGSMEKLFWGGKAVGLRIDLRSAPADAIRDLVAAAWALRAPKQNNKGRKGQ